MLHYQRKEKCLENTAIVLALDLQIGNLGSLSKGGGDVFTSLKQCYFSCEECYMKSTLVRNLRVYQTLPG